MFAADSQCHMITVYQKHKEKARESNDCLSHRLGSRIAHLSRINNADAHASDILIKVHTKTWTSNIVLPSDRLEFARFKAVADKTSVQRLSIMFAASFHRNSVAKLGIIWLLQPKNHPKKEKRTIFCYLCRLIIMQTTLKP